MRVIPATSPPSPMSSSSSLPSFASTPSFAPCIGRLHLPWLQPFTPTELLVVYLILSIGTAWVGHDSLQVLMPQIIYPFRYASPENRWDELFLPFLPKWLYVSDKTALLNAYAGGHRFWAPENFRPWVLPLLGWGSFCVALSWLMVGFCLLVRRRWMDEERLTYPVLYLPKEITRLANPLWHSTPFWLGFSISAFIDLLNGFAALFPSLPSIKVRVWNYDQLLASLFVGYPLQALQGTRMSFYPFAIGLGLLLPPDLLFSCWVFYWLERMQRLVGLMVGWTQLPGYPWTNFQAFGGYAGIALFALWVARHSFAQTMRRALSGQDREERMGLAMMAVGLLFLLTFAHAMGMSLPTGALFFAIYLLLLLSITRIRAELGPPAHDLHYAGPDEILIALFGPQGLSKRDLIVAKLFYWFNRAYRSLPCPHYLEGLKVAKDEGVPFRAMTVIMLIASVVSIAAAMLVHLHCFYAYGITAKFVGPAITAFGGEPFLAVAKFVGSAASTQSLSRSGDGCRDAVHLCVNVASCLRHLVSAASRRLRHLHELEHECLVDAFVHRLLGEDGDVADGWLSGVSANGVAPRRRVGFGRMDGRQLLAALRCPSGHPHIRLLGLKRRRGKSLTRPPLRFLVQATLVVGVSPPVASRGDASRDGIIALPSGDNSQF
jgi:hypothetical protein